MFLYTCFCYYFEQVYFGEKVIKVALKLHNFSEFRLIAVKERKMSASTLLMNEAN